MTSRIIAIAGPSGSGKSTFAENLLSHLRHHLPELEVALLAEDSYYRDQRHLSLEQRTGVNYDHPSALEHELLIEHLRALRAGQTVDVPRYDFTRHTRQDQTRRQLPAPVIVVEGQLLLTNAALRELFDLRLFVDAPLELCLQRRIARDSVERGRSPDSVKAQFEATVRPMFHAHVAPSRAHAELVVPGEGDHEATLAELRRRLQSELETAGAQRRSTDREVQSP